MNKKIVILSGGCSEEKEVSKVTAAKAAEALRSRNYETILIDPTDFPSYSEMIKKIKEISPMITFNGLHGTDGEDGKVQSLFDLEGLLLTGSGYRASAIAMDKFITAKLAYSLSIRIPKCIRIADIEDFSKKAFIREIRFPMVIKPNDSGSSVGISIIESEDEIDQAIKDAFKYSDKILFEEFIPGRELTVTILDGKPLPVVEIIPQAGWYDYFNKYTRGNTQYEVPAELTEDQNSTIQEKALNIYKLIGCKCYARVDFRFDGKHFYFLELNTLPGLTPLSLTPMAAKATGLDFPDLLVKIIECSLKK